jgi:hypothetical protein
MPGTVPDILEFGSPAHRSFVLSLENVNLSFRKIRDPASMIDIQVGQNDVTYISALEAQPFNMSNRCFIWIKPWVHYRREYAPQSFDGTLDIEESKACVDQYQAFICFNENAVADDMVMSQEAIGNSWA